MIESLVRTKRKLREMIAELESDLGVGPAYPVTIKLLEGHRRERLSRGLGTAVGRGQGPDLRGDGSRTATQLLSADEASGARVGGLLVGQARPLLAGV